jgi:hypothetical protein
LSIVKGILKAYFWNVNEDGIGTAVFSVESPRFTDVFTEPSEPGHQNPTYILAKIELSPAVSKLSGFMLIMLLSATN